MNGIPLTKYEINRIIELRKKGHSLSEIMEETKRGSGTVHKYIKNVIVPLRYSTILKSKQGGSKLRSLRDWDVAKKEARSMMENISTLKQKMYLLSGIYWGEGDKRELGLINSDPQLVRCFISCLGLIGISKDMLRVSLRLFEDVDVNKSVEFWSKTLFIDKNDINVNEIIKGKKFGKLKYGMCRVRVAKSSRYFKLLMSIIDEVKSKI